MGCADPYRRILGVLFFTGQARDAVVLGARGGLVVAPAAPALLDLARDAGYRQAVLEADLAIADSGLMVLLWNLLMRDDARRVSGLEYLRHLLARPEFKQPQRILWVMPTPEAEAKLRKWLDRSGFNPQNHWFYQAPKYLPQAVADPDLRDKIDTLNPWHVVVGVGGGIQEKLGLYLKRECHCRPAIHCVGAAVGFISGDQAHIPRWADRLFLGWLFRCCADPGRFVPRYWKAIRLAPMIWRYRTQPPPLVELRSGGH